MLLRMGYTAPPRPGNKQQATRTSPERRVPLLPVACCLLPQRPLPVSSPVYPLSSDGTKTLDTKGVRVWPRSTSLCCRGTTSGRRLRARRAACSRPPDGASATSSASRRHWRAVRPTTRSASTCRPRRSRPAPRPTRSSRDRSADRATKSTTRSGRASSRTRSCRCASTSTSTST